jgi:hypothetical protein
VTLLGKENTKGMDCKVWKRKMEKYGRQKNVIWLQRNCLESHKTKMHADGSCCANLYTQAWGKTQEAMCGASLCKYKATTGPHKGRANYYQRLSNLTFMFTCLIKVWQFGLNAKTSSPRTRSAADPELRKFSDVAVVIDQHPRVGQAL